ncbi:polysialyltransferase family glycosyltransferase [Maribacter antarcticus]|uniref:polysialyltransferase family glycosyltransferase n=1 Tax=Maribacter antarcticus TaxID=505250 RepID=UPI000479E95D|nr:polysialyltransferase family glycosyltransferase [Maribacter antarcticus]
MEIKNIIIVLTPFQKDTMERLFENLFKQKSTLIYHSEHTSFKTYNSEILTINNFKFSKNRLLNYKYYLECKKAIAIIRKEINGLEAKYSFHEKLNMYIGSEKDIFTQMFLQTPFINSKLNDLIAIEEGLGYYKYKSNWKITLTKYVYQCLTPLLFKEKLKYIYTLGLYPRINKVYARLPQMLPIKRENVEYLSIDATKRKVTKKYNAHSNKILIFSLPNQDYDLNEEEKFRIFSKLINSFVGKAIIIKPHPRENALLFDRFSNNKDVQILRKDEIGESIDYFEFEKIFNFSSSVIIDILTTGYPKKAVHTIFIKGSSNLIFFKETTCIKLIELENYNFES